MVRVRAAGVFVSMAAVAALIAAPGSDARAPAVGTALKAADAPAAQLKTSATTTLPGGTVVHRFTQEAGGVPVVGAGAVVTDSVSGPPELLFDTSRPGIDAPGDAVVSRSQAISAAVATVAGKPVAEPSARQVILPGDGGTLAWEVTVSTAAPADWVIRLDASSAEVLERFNEIDRALASAKLFVPNAVVANDGYGGIKDKKDADSQKLTDLRDAVTLQNLNDGQTCLKGEFVNVKRGSKAKKVCRDTLDWNKVKRKSNTFEALMAYYHIDEAQKYIQSLDLDPINAESQNVIANAIPDDNSFYSPGRDEIQTGTGGVDDGEDADVIVHEYGHSVQDAQNHEAFAGGSGFDNAGAMGEGFGDYLSQAYSTETVGFDNEWSHCVMEWDATSYDNNHTPPPGICLRRADNENTLAEQTVDCGGTEIHCIGETWASALFEVRQDLGDDGASRSIMDRVVLASHELLPPAATFASASTALLEADEDLYPAGTADDGQGVHCDAIADEMVERGFILLSPCT